MKEIDDFYLQQDEPIKGCFLALRKIILSQDIDITHTLKYGMPSFSYKGKVFCYFWFHKRRKQPYLLMVEGKHLNHPDLIQENRARMKIMLFDPEKDLPLPTIETIIQQALDLYKKGEIRI
jgi:Domain of unknown function (DU1801)